MRAGLVEDIKELRKYPWTGHSALMGIIQRKWQDTDTVPAYFGSRLKQAQDRYQEFVEAGIAQGRRKDPPDIEGAAGFLSGGAQEDGPFRCRRCTVSRGDDFGSVPGGRPRGILGPEEIPLSLFRNAVP